MAIAIYYYIFSRIPDSARCSVAESDTELVNETNGLSNQKVNSQKSNSPANGSISSVEDESGFSSMNSFQEVGLPVVNSVVTEEVNINIIISFARDI